MNYQEALDFIHGTHKFSIKLGLDNVGHLLKLMGNPQDSLRYIHVAGTNGKGSTSSYMNQMLMAAGYKVGLYTSPFLEAFNERMQVNSENISNESLAEITTDVKGFIDLMLADGLNHPTEFEIVTAIAFEYFKREAVDLVVLEVGMGGRLDSTNVIKTPLISVITPVDLDHVEYLGDTIEKVAAEKAGIIKPNGITVIHPQAAGAMTVIETVCQQMQNKLIVAPTAHISVQSVTDAGTSFSVDGEAYQIRMLGEHQTRNATVAITAIQTLNGYADFIVSQEAILKGLSEAIWHGRMEIMKRDPIVLIDGAHNLHGTKGLSKAVKTLFKGKHIVAVVGILGDKDVSGMLSEMVPLCHTVICTEPDNPRKMTADQLEIQVKAFGVETYTEPDIAMAYDKALALATKDSVVILFGSLYMIGAARTVIINHQ
jgi:dihydrofolate synthase/folylpolyglutamate synthase